MNKNTYSRNTPISLFKCSLKLFTNATKTDNDRANIVLSVEIEFFSKDSHKLFLIISMKAFRDRNTGPELSSIPSKSSRDNTLLFCVYKATGFCNSLRDNLQILRNISKASCK